jgi:hypothetical protein
MIHRFAIGQTDFGITTTASGGAGNVNISAGSTSIVSTAFTFSNSNGVTFGIDTNAQLTASVQTNYQTPGAYLTTAMASNRGSDFVQATAAFHGTNASGTINSNNISVSVAAPAAQSINISAGTTSSNVSAVTFSNANGVSFGYDGTNVTATVATNYAGTGTSATNASITLNTAGLAISVAAGSNSSWTVSDSATSMTVARLAFTQSNGLTLSLSTTTGGSATVVGSYTVPSTAGLLSNIKLSAGTLSNNLSAVTFADSNGVSWGLNTNSVITATVATNYLTTAALSSQTLVFSLGGNSATTNSSQISNGGYVLAGGNSLTIQQSNNSISFSVGNYITTADLSQNSSKYAGTGFTTATTAGTAIVGTLNTSGLSMGVPAYLTTAEQSRQPLSYFANMPFFPGGATTGCQSNTWYVLPLTVPEKISISYMRLIGAIAYTSTTIATSAVNNATGASTAFSETVQWNAVLYTMGTGANSRSLQYVYSSSAGITWAVSVSQASTSNASQQSFTQKITYPSQGFNTNNTSTQYSVSATNGPISTTQWANQNLDGNRFLDIPFATSLAAGNYWLALNRFTGTVGGIAIDVGSNTHGASQPNQVTGIMGSAVNVSQQGPQIGHGSWTTNVAQTTSSIALASISATSSYFLPYVQFINQA